MKKLKVIALEVEVLRQEGHRVPSSMAADRWRDLLMLETKSQRMRLLAFWWTNEKKREADKRKKQERKKKREEELAMIKEGETDDGHIKYGFGGSTIFIRVYDSKIDAMHNSKLVRAMQFGQDLVVDCSYTSHMTIKEASNCAKQMMMMFAENRIHDDPFNMHFCSAVRDDNVMSRLFKFIPTMYDASFPMNITPKSHLDLFPKERLVYLTPHCREELRTYSHHDVYIIGAMVDKANNEPLSLAKAKSQGLRMAKLPLDRYLAWGMGSKSLTLNQVLAILLDMKSNGGDWEAALRKNVPQRKVVTKEQAEREISARIRQERRRQQRLYY
ncbi:hypothetical protein AAG570_009800 [Ranatra chinensis]|uniref:RNA (guanine-9-)-methyltransferase domain-containing protein 1 n=1 Tax=Ranatra chinensis TaxID=642074 RepID=A0ABD0YQ47_9HEMI